MRTKIAATTVGLIGAELDLGEVVPIGSLQIEGDQLERRRASAIVTFTREIFRAAGTAGQTLFSLELRTAAARVVDMVFLDSIVSSQTEETTVATIPEAIAAVFATLMTYQTSKVFLVSDPATAALAAGLVGSAGMMFPNLSPSGGKVGETPFLVSDTLDSGVLMAIDADQILASQGALSVDATDQADLQLSDGPLGGAQNLTGLWQSSSSALKINREYGFWLRDPGAVSRAIISGLAGS